jgi:hypothetical protein
MKKFKKHIIIAWIWGLAMSFFGGTPMDITLTGFIVSPPLFAFVLLFATFLLAFIISLFVKNDEEKEMKTFNIAFNIILALGIFMLINSALVDYIIANDGF